jgi:hypothetical protein
MSFEQKYLKYKKKYIDLKNQIGGDLCPNCNLETVTGECKCQNVKTSYYPSLSGSDVDFEEKGLSKQDIALLFSTRNSLETLFRFDPLVLQEGVDYSYAHIPTKWVGPHKGGILARESFAILLKDVNVTFIPSGKNLGVFKKDYMFRVMQYGSKLKGIPTKNKALFNIADIGK